MAMIIQAYKHEETGKIFDDKGMYCKFIREFNRKKLKENLDLDKKQKYQDLLHQCRLTATSIDDFVHKWVLLWNNTHLRFKSTLEMKLDVVYAFNVSNSHNCPIGEVTNWERKDDKPKYYPGWIGEVSGVIKNYVDDITFQKLYVLDNPKPNCGSLRDCISGLNTHSGNGNESFRFDVSMFLIDFPLIFEKYRSVLDKESSLKEEARKLLDLKHQWFGDKANYISCDPSIKDIVSKQEELELDISKKNEALKIFKASYNSHVEEIGSKFEIENPLDLSREREIGDQLNYIQSIIKL